MRSYVLDAAAPADVGPARCFPVEEDPAGWVWTHQQPLVISRLEAESRWPEFTQWVRTAGLRSLTLVPLTAGENRLGAFGFGCLAPFAPSGEELAFLERVASEFAVAVESFLAKQELLRERDRLRTLFDITKVLVSKLSPDELFAAISAQLSRVVRHDFAMLTLWNEKTRELDALRASFYRLCTVRRRAGARALRRGCPPPRRSRPGSRSWHTTPIWTAILLRIFAGLWQRDASPGVQFH